MTEIPIDYDTDPFISPPKTKEKDQVHMWNDSTYAEMLLTELNEVQQKNSREYAELLNRSITKINEIYKTKYAMLWRKYSAYSLSTPSQKARKFLDDIFGENTPPGYDETNEETLIILAAIFEAKLENEGTNQRKLIYSNKLLADPSDYWLSIHSYFTINAISRAEKNNRPSDFSKNKREPDDEEEKLKNPVAHPSSCFPQVRNCL